MSVQHPKVFISYSHDSEEHRAWVLRLSERLRLNGFETQLDRYVQGTPPQGWPRWMLNQLDWAEFVLIVCTATYYRRFRGQDAPGVGKGVDWEGGMITNELYVSKSVTTKFVPVLVDRADEVYIPEPLHGVRWYLPADSRDYSALTDFLTGIAGIEPAPIGELPTRERRRAPADSEQPAPLVPVLNVNIATPSHGLAAVDIANHVAPGGTMPSDDVLYIERSADVRASAAAKRRCETLVIKGPRQFGKSSLLTRYLDQCRGAGKTVVYLDFSAFEEATLVEYGRFLSKLASLLASRLGRPQPQAPIVDQQAFGSFLEHTLLPSIPGVIVFAFDETDRTLRQRYAADFFTMVRMWHNDRVDPVLAWHRLGLALVSSSEPKLFITDPMRSPFNVGERLDLSTFTAPEVAKLNARYGSPLTAAQCNELHELLGGHPYLTQDAFYRLLGPDATTFPALIASAAMDDGPFGDHLRAMLANLHSAEGLLPALRSVIRGGAPTQQQYYRLEGAGMVCRKAGRIVPANRIYRDFFMEGA